VWIIASAAIIALNQFARPSNEKYSIALSVLYCLNFFAAGFTDQLFAQENQSAVDVWNKKVTLWKP
jgi:hypothetical protein